MGNGDQHLAAVDGHHVTGGELAAAAGLDHVIHPHIAPLDALLGLAAAGGQGLPFEELIQLQNGRTAQAGGT
jgi:hypothetical protein